MKAAAMKRTYYIIIISVLVLIVAAYLFTKYSVLKTNKPKPDLSKSESPIDLRPLIIAKLQQLVKDGSEGLYNLSVDRIEPDILQSKADVFDVTLTPDSAALKNLDSLKKLPDDIFKFSFRKLHITGINIDDLLHKDRIDLDSVLVSEPVIEAYHNPKKYNQSPQENITSTTLYKKLSGQLKHFSIHTIGLEHGTLTHKNIAQDNRVEKFKDINVRIIDLLFDSSTQYDKSRFLFSKDVQLTCRDYLAKTPDSLYFFKAGFISIDAARHTMTGKNVALVPRGNKKEFEKKLKFSDNRFDIQMPKVVFKDIDWWSLVNNEYFLSKEAYIYDAHFGDYIDRSLPERSDLNVHNFPQQLLMNIPLKVNIGKLNLLHAQLTYEEFDPKIKKSGKIYFDNVNGSFGNVTNVASAIKRNNIATFKGSGLFMHTVPMQSSFRFDLARYKTGEFSADISIGSMDSSVVNPFSETLGLFTVKKGTLQKANAHLTGNNFSAKSDVLMLYNDLHLVPLKKDNNAEGSLKKKTLTSFIANTFLIKNDNPSHGEAPRRPQMVVDRDHHESFFNFVWKTILAGILKTIGVPVSYMNKQK